MRLYRTLKTALGALRRNVMRTLLTTLGIVIGVAAVITMMEIGNGASIAIQRTMASMGANTLVIMPGAVSIGGVNHGIGQHDDADAAGCGCDRQRVPRRRQRGADRARPHPGGVRQSNWVPTYIYGTTPSFLAGARLDRLDEGEAFTEHDVRNASKVCIVGQTIVKELVRRTVAHRQGCPHPECGLQGHRRVAEERART